MNLLSNRGTHYKVNVTDDHRYTLLPTLREPSTFQVTGYIVVDNITGTVAFRASTFGQAVDWVTASV